MPTQLYEDDVQDRILEYWNYHHNDFDYYINKVIGIELTWARENPITIDGKTVSRLQKLEQPVHTLAITVGESLEPLLQIICVLKPQRVVAVLNEKYGEVGGQHRGQVLKNKVQRLPDASDLPDQYRHALPEFVPVVLENDTPTEVFRALRDALQEPQSQPPAGSINVVDITGAKKSMVVGAFLYAAHSELPITYVDFEEYDTKRGRPYGHRCKIGRIDDPYAAFQLRDWEQVRQLYERYNFRGAYRLLGEKDTNGGGTGILGAMTAQLSHNEDTRTLYDEQDTQKVERLIQLLELYEMWEHGQFVQAKELANRFSPPLPEDVLPVAITHLSSIWPHVVTPSTTSDLAQQLLVKHRELKRGGNDPQNSFFNKPQELLSYIYDEQAKVKRLLDYNEDTRSAFLRAAGLHEFLLKARLAFCWFQDWLEFRQVTQAPDGRRTETSLGVVSNLDQDRTRRLFKKLVKNTADDMYKVLRRASRDGYIKINNQEFVRLTATAPQLANYWGGISLSVDILLHLRNESIHTHLYIPEPVARAACALADSALQEFEAHWLTPFCGHTSTPIPSFPTGAFEAPNWSRICTVCELDFLPPKLQIASNEKE